VRGHACANVDGDAADFLTHRFALTRMQTGAHLKAAVAYRLQDRACAADRPDRPVECYEEAVAGGIDLAPAKSVELSANECVVALDQLRPPRIAQFGPLTGERHEAWMQVRDDGLALLDHNAHGLVEQLSRVAAEGSSA
jgi:hypothetical protein